MRTWGKLLVFATVVAFGTAAVPAEAYHINGDEDPVLSVITGDTVTNDMWWAGTSVVVPGITITTVTITDPIGGDELEQEVGIDDVDVGLRACERNAGFAGLIPPASAGWGGRCYSSIDRTGTHLALPSPDVFVWMAVQADTGSKCDNAWKSTGGAKYFARVGNNDHGLEVARSESFHYNELLVAWVADWHVTYVLDAPDAGGGWLHCYGDDDHVPMDRSSLPAAMCNDTTDPDFDAFDPATYHAVSAGGTGAQNTVCVA